MNAGKQELFESVRAVVTGRLRDEAQVREIAHRVSEESTALRRRMQRAVGYARAGLRLEACAEAEAEPSIFELAAAFDTDVMRQWRNLCAKNRLPMQDEIDVEAIAEIEEAITLTGPLRRRLANMRRLVLSDASAWSRLEALRDLISRDPDNPAWQEDRMALEPVAGNELGDLFEASLRGGKLEEAELCVTRLEGGGWHWSGAGKVGAQLRAKLDRALAERAVVEARETVAQLDAEWSAENEHGARAAMQRWREIEQRMLSYGSDMPSDLLARVDEVEAWLSARESDAEAIRENRDRVGELERLAHEDSATLAQLRSALAAAEQTFEGVPDDVRAAAERRIGAFERKARAKRIALVAVIVMFLAGAVVAAVMLVKSVERSKRADEFAREVDAKVTEGKLDEAQKQLELGEKSPELAGTPQLAGARERWKAAVARKKEDAERFAKLMRDAGEPSSQFAKQELVEQARALAQTPDDRAKVDEWLRKHRDAEAKRNEERMQRGLAEAKEIADGINRTDTSGGAELDSSYREFSRRLSQVSEKYRDLGDVQNKVQAAKAALELKIRKSSDERSERSRKERLSGLGEAATSPAALAKALEDYCKDYVKAPETADFREALEARASWDAVVAWEPGKLRDFSGSELSKSSQEKRGEALAIIEECFPDEKTLQASPIKDQLDEMKGLLQPAPEWRSWYAKRLDDPEFKYYVVVQNTAGRPIRYYCDVNPNPPVTSAGGQPQYKFTPVNTKIGKTLPASEVDKDRTGPSPQRSFAAQQRKRWNPAEETVNDVYSAFDAIEELKRNEDMDGAISAYLMQGLLESMVPQMPALVGDDMGKAAAKIGKAAPKMIEWRTADDDEARSRSADARKLMNDVAQPKAWREKYVSKLKELRRQLDQSFAPAGVLMKPVGGTPEIRFAGKASHPAGTVFWTVRPPIGDKPAEMVDLATAGPEGVQFKDAALSTTPAGTMVFTERPVR
jgi:hypothetical protein